MLDTVFNLLKVVAIVGVASIFVSAIQGFLSIIQIVVFHNVIDEFLQLISMYLPFNAGVVFGAIGTSIVSIFSFLIAKKIFDLTSWSISSV